MLNNFINEEVLLKFLQIVIVFSIGIFIYYIIKIVFSYSLTSKTKKHPKETKKLTTINYVTLNIIKYIILFIVLLIILGILGVNTTSILASVGIISLVIGWSLQDTIKDFAAGISIVFNKQFEIGDEIEIDGFLGEVIDMGLKITKVQSWTGEVKIVNNRNIDNVINYTQNLYVISIDLKISSKEDSKKVIKTLQELENNVLEIDGVKGNYQVLGVNDIEDSNFIYRVIVSAKAYKRYTIRREILKIILEEFDKKNITLANKMLEVKYDK